MKKAAIFAATWLVFLFGATTALAEIAIEDLVRDQERHEHTVQHPYRKERCKSRRV